MKSLIGKNYIPYDNSWSVNVTSSGDYPYKNENKYLAGTNNTDSKFCKIVSEPFICNTLTNICKNSKDKKEMIMVECNKETHMVLFHKSCVRE